MKIQTILIGLITLSRAFAQEPAAPSPKPEPPPGPLLKNAPDFASWTIEVKAEGDLAGDGKPAVPGPDGKVPINSNNKRIAVVKTGPVRLEQDTDAFGNAVQTWQVPNYRILVPKSGGIPDVTFVPSSSSSHQVSDFPDAAWVSKSSFENVGIVGGVKCLIFKHKETEADSAISEEVACINFDTRLPVYVKLDDVIYSYKFGPVPRAVLALPADLQAAVALLNQRMKQANSAPVAP
jgi:hypothetical protein